MTATATKDKDGNKTVTTDQRIDKMEKALGDIINRLSNTPANGHNPEQVFGGRNIRTGENPLSSRGYSLIKALGLLRGGCEEENCKIERDISNRLVSAYCKSMGNAGYESRGGGEWGKSSGRILVPLSTSFMQEGVINSDFRHEMKSLMCAGSDGADYDEMKWIRSKMLADHYGIAREKALSWLGELNGGSLVAPPEQGELIELLRNKEALVNAGARTVPLPPQGRLLYPRQTTASNTFWVGENSPITESQLGTGTVTLQAKKLCVLTKAPNELVRFASPAAEALIRDDMTKSLALGLDLAGLEGLGGDTRPLGVINQPGINVVTSSLPGPNGDALRAEDVYRMIAVIEENNAECEGFIMRPKTLYRYFQLRFDAVGQGDAAGGFLFNLIREAGDGMKATLGGMPVTKSTQVSQVRSKGSASNLTYILSGMWSDMLIGMFGAIEFAATMQGDTSFVNDQTWIRGILTADIALRHSAAFALLDSLSVNA